MHLLASLRRFVQRWSTKISLTLLVFGAENASNAIDIQIQLRLQWSDHGGYLHELLAFQIRGREMLVLAVYQLSDPLEETSEPTGVALFPRKEFCGFKLVVFYMIDESERFEREESKISTQFCRQESNFMVEIL